MNVLDVFVHACVCEYYVCACLRVYASMKEWLESNSKCNANTMKLIIQMSTNILLAYPVSTCKRLCLFFDGC